MRRALFLAAALTLVTAPMVLAQDHDHDHGGGGRPSGEPHPGGHGEPSHNAAPPAAHANDVRGQPRAAFQGGPYPARPPGGYGGYPGGQPYRGGQAYQGRQDYRGAPGFQGGPNGYHGPQGYRGNDNGFRGGPGFHGPGQFSYRGRNFASFRAAPFRYPQGWGYRRWGVGAFLPGLFLGDVYFIGDWGAYNLGPPPPGEHWVRYGPDALLVNNYTGQVDDVAYGVFYW